MNDVDKQYLDLVKDILERGNNKEDRTGTGTFSLFGSQLRFNLSEGFPLLTTKKLHLRSIIYELLWFLKGDTNVKYLNDNGVSIWDEWKDENGDLGPIYGKQWVNWGGKTEYDFKWNGEKYEYVHIDFPGINQIQKAIDTIKTNPNSRRIIVNAWNVSDLDKMALTPCHTMFQFYVANGKLSCQMYQRSADIGLGVPFNIASYALLTMMVAQVCNLELGELIISFGDVHIYKNHIDALEEQLKRDSRELPIMKINEDVKNIFKFKYEDFELINYNPHPPIKMPIAI